MQVGDFPPRTPLQKPFDIGDTSMENSLRFGDHRPDPGDTSRPGLNPFSTTYTPSPFIPVRPRVVCGDVDRQWFRGEVLCYRQGSEGGGVRVGSRRHPV